MFIFLKNISFYGIFLDVLFDEDNVDWEEVFYLLEIGIYFGVV